MGAVTGMLGLGGGASGADVAAPQAANLMRTATDEQMQKAYGDTQNSMQAQQGLLTALQGQGGLGAQNMALSQMQGVASGQGPNPAQAQYQKNVQDLATQQAGAIASIKGISPALAARMIAQQGSAAMQNAAGQGAANLANQQLGAMQQAGNMANTIASNQIGQTNANVGSQQQEQQSLLNAASGYNNAAVGNQSSVNAGNTAITGAEIGNQGKIIGGIGQAAGSAMHLAAYGGEMHKFADGGDASAFNGPRSKFGQFLNQSAQQQQAAPIQMSNVSMPAPDQSNSLENGIGNFLKGAASRFGGSGDSSGAAPGGPQSMSVPMTAYSMGGQTHDYRGGGNVIAKNSKQKAVKPGNDYANDKIPAVLSEGEVVIPRNVMQSKDPVNGAAQFVQAVLAKRRMK